MPVPVSPQAALKAKLAAAIAAQKANAATAAKIAANSAALKKNLAAASAV